MYIIIVKAKDLIDLYHEARSLQTNSKIGFIYALKNKHEVSLYLFLSLSISLSLSLCIYIYI